MMLNQHNGIRKFSRLYQPKLSASDVSVALIQLLIGGCLVVSFQGGTKAAPANQVFLVAQSVINGLPPPPNYPQQGLPQESIPTEPLPPNPPNNSVRDREFTFQAPPGRSPSRRGPRVYRVYVNSDSQLILQQIRNVEPEAYVRQGEGIIQAGVYVDQSRAKQRVRELEQLGLQARMTTIASGDSGRRVRSNFYYVVIPSRKADLPRIADQVTRLGVTTDAVRPREGPRGSHIAVGPFNERSQAERWNSYLRANNLDARLYFGR